MEVIKFLAVGLCLIPLISVANALGRIWATAMESIARNPSAKDDIRNIAILGMATTELIGLFSLLIAMIILFVV